MIGRFTMALVGACLLASAPAQAGVEPSRPVELRQMMGRWYEVARVPNKLQNGCVAGESQWSALARGFTVVQSCHRGGPDGPKALWKAKATVADPSTNAKFRMAFFGGVVTQDYVILDHRPDQGWLVLATANGRYLWLMSQKPSLPEAVKAQALARIRQMGFDVGRLEFPLPARS